MLVVGVSLYYLYYRYFVSNIGEIVRYGKIPPYVYDEPIFGQSAHKYIFLAMVSVAIIFLIYNFLIFVIVKKLNFSTKHYFLITKISAVPLTLAIFVYILTPWSYQATGYSLRFMRVGDFYYIINSKKTISSMVTKFNLPRGLKQIDVKLIMKYENGYLCDIKANGHPYKNTFINKPYFERFILYWWHVTRKTNKKHEWAR